MVPFIEFIAGGWHMNIATAENQVLPLEMLQRFAKRAGDYDRDNRFVTEDFEELRKSGFLTLCVPPELGGKGYTLAQSCQEQRKLAYHAPATALAVNMHVY